MKATNLSRSLLIISAAILAFSRSSFADGSEPPDVSGKAEQMPSLETLLATALSHNADIRVAEAQLDRSRLQVTKEIMLFRRQWQSETAALTAARAELKQAEQEMERLKALSGAVSGTKLLEVERLAKAARRRVATTEDRLNEMKSMLPYLIGVPIAEEASHDHQHQGRDSHGISAPVEKLLRERLEVLVQVAQLQQKAYETGEAGFEDVSSAQTDVLVAHLELVETVEERKNIRQQMLDVSRQIEDTTNQLFQAREATQVDVLKAKALRLRAEADLAREQESGS